MKSRKSRKSRKSGGGKRFSARAKQGGRRGRGRRSCPNCGSYDFIRMEDYNGEYWACRDCHYQEW